MRKYIAILIGIIAENNAEEVKTSGLFEGDITYEDFIEHFKDIIHYLDYPIVGPGVFPQYMVNKFASEHVKVLLGGQGGDEIFAGYARYLIVYLEQVIHGSINETQINNHIVNLDTVSKALPTLKDYIPLIKKMWAQNLFTDPTTRYENILERTIPNNWFSNDLLEIIKDSKEIFYNKMNEINEKSLINKMLHFDIKYILPGLLQVEDRVSMAHSLESRVPYLDQNVFNSAINLNPTLKFGQGVLKSPLKEISKKYLPEKISLRIADVLEYSPTKDAFIQAIGAHNVATLDEIKQLHLYDFGIFIEQTSFGDILTNSLVAEIVEKSAIEQTLIRRSNLS